MEILANDVSVRREIVDNLKKIERPESLTSELLDEVYMIDEREAMAGAALFAVDRESYKAPSVHQLRTLGSNALQQETLFN